MIELYVGDRKWHSANNNEYVRDGETSITQFGKYCTYKHTRIDEYELPA